ncbi:MAG: hypothetical protein LBN22_08785 [Clostridiales Family XIII bacterium]|nr:hypothetical protein [Clostridiales Family XIII bacterium]
MPQVLIIICKCLIGFALGTATSFLNFKINELLILKAFAQNTKNKAQMLVPLSYFIRLGIYGVVFYLCAKQSVLAGILCVCGFLVKNILLVIQHAIQPKFKDVKYDKVPQEYFTFEKRVSFQRKHKIILDGELKIRYYKTHRRFYNFARKRID